jgi:Ca-activated chloride channel family protein
MCATDIPPHRLHSAKEAALSFIEGRVSSTQIGVVGFAGFAELIQPPTTDQELLQDSVENLTTARRTAIGSAILESIDAIAEINEAVAPSSTSGASPEVELTPVPEGEYVPDIIVLLTDGASNQGPYPLDAAQEAVDRGVRVYTIGFGTANGSRSLPYCDQPFQSDPFGNEQRSGGLGFGGGGGFRRGIDEVTLKEIADMTGGDYYSAESASELQEVFENLPTYLITREETTEVSAIFTAIGALFAGLAIVLSLIWHPLP